MKRRPALLPIMAALLAVYLVAPFVAGVAQLGMADWGGADLPALLHASGVSLASATCATVLVTLGGIPLGYLLARTQSRAMAVLGFAVQLPLALPPLASGILLLFLLGYASPLGHLTQGALTDSFAGIVLAEAFVAAPFLIIAARSAFAGVDPLLEDVAATLGHGPWAVFHRVGLALSWRAILAGMLLAWLRAFGEFGATVMVAYHPYSLPVYTYVAFGSQGLPAMLPVLAPTLVVAGLVMALSQAALRPAARMPDSPAPLAPLAPRAAAPPGADGPCLEVDGPCLEVHARRRLAGFDLDVAWRGTARRVAILGASGSGKSLTLRVIAGLGGDAGSVVRFDRRDLGGLPPEARGIAWVPQNYALLPNLSLAEQIRFAVDCDPQLAALWTGRLGLSGLEHRRPAELSLGQQQRVALARALARRSARLILLDEPFSALDTPLRLRLREEMLMLQRELRASTILVTHDPAEAMLLADDLLLLEAGRVLQCGRVSDVFARPADPAAARLLGVETVGHGHVVAPDRIDLGRGVVLAVGGPPLPQAMAVGWAIRSYQVRLGMAGNYPGRILRRGAIQDGQRRVRLRLGACELDVLADPGCPEEGECRVRIDPDAVQVWPDAPIPAVLGAPVAETATA